MHLYGMDLGMRFWVCYEFQFVLHETYSLIKQRHVFFILAVSKMGRKLVYRSEPPVLKRKHRESQEKRDKEEEGQGGGGTAVLLLI